MFCFLLSSSLENDVLLGVHCQKEEKSGESWFLVPVSLIQFAFCCVKSRFNGFFILHSFALSR